ncbi:MAG: glycosyltransferase family 2 protein [Jatrophihabitans sp.]|uniref:glycosyltransferase family 2 protein n=1 Tax=Jatrophihabitans sp. TaxID=1932789 RepID=UPI003F8050CF
MTPHVSVVVPTFNNADYIEATMASILAQTYSDFELIVADHASTDGTWERLQRYRDDPRLTLLQTPAGGGARANWQRVTDAASGDLLKLVCGDDVIYPDCLQEQVAALDAAPDAVLAASPRDIVDADGRVVVRSRGLGGLQGVVEGPTAVRRSVRLGTNIFGEPGCVLLRRDRLAAIGGWDDTFPYLIDQFTYSRLLLGGRFAAVPRTLAAFRVNMTQWSVRLAEVQARQAAGMHHALRLEAPQLLSRADVAVGDVRASATALLRRSAYAVLRRRMARAAG